MEVVLRCENYVQVNALTVVDFTMLYVVTRRLLLSSRASSLVINLLTIWINGNTLSRIVNKLITNNEMRDDNNNRRVTPTVKWEPSHITRCEINNGKSAWGRGTPHMKGVGMLFVLLRGVNFGFWSHLGCSGKNTIIFSREGLV